MSIPIRAELQELQFFTNNSVDKPATLPRLVGFPQSDAPRSDDVAAKQVSRPNYRKAIS